MDGAGTDAGVGAPHGDAKAMKALEIILLIVLVAFGTGKLRSAGSDLAAMVRGFRAALRGAGPSSKGATGTPPPLDTRPDAEFPERRPPRGGA